MAAVQAALTKAPKLGRKQVFLPNFTLTLLRTPKHPPTFATFIVPLNFNKLDLRDYLYNVYGVPVRGVRSYIQQQKIRQDKVMARRPKPRQWFRPRSIKKMMVEMESPFVWPEEPKDFDMWDKKAYDAAHEDQDEQQARYQPDYREKPRPDRSSLADQAKALQSGNSSWKDNAEADEWEDVGEEMEVEQDVVVPRIEGR